MTVGTDSTCLVCGSDRFRHDDVLWPALVESWQLSPEETAYVNVQQGTRCERCGTNVRSQALARALLGVVKETGTLETLIYAGSPLDRRLLEINEAGTLTPWLSRMPQHVLARYPEIDVTRLPYPDASFDLVLHSDTLEHVPDARAGLRECRRVLAAGGASVFTVPLIVGRLTRSRAGLPPSYHGHPDCRDEDFQVQTEFGADAWTWLFEAGFTRCELVPFRYPAGIAVIGWR
ncbi:MAG: methyltransferase domain-containing protein [Vicinamibacterales bacterium]